MKKLLFYIFVTLFIGGIPSIVVATNNTYNTLNKPPLSPPGILFPIVWTILFILMGISVYLVREDKEAVKYYFIQLIVNALWTPIFFGLNAYLLSFIWLVILIVLVVIMLDKFKEVNKTSVYLNIPYVIWLVFALYLNAGIFLLN